ncbi:MAG TPA: hypothetical protein VKA87_01900 [Nitrososphaeraceae archaeon]|nr:hypothetical protein [Nitrososphaeraceae archaeon]
MIGGLRWWQYRRMGRTIPSFRIALAMEKEDLKLFCNALDRSFLKVVRHSYRVKVAEMPDKR